MGESLQRRVHRPDHQADLEQAGRALHHDQRVPEGPHRGEGGGRTLHEGAHHPAERAYGARPAGLCPGALHQGNPLPAGPPVLPEPGHRAHQPRQDQGPPHAAGHHGHEPAHTGPEEAADPRGGRHRAEVHPPLRGTAGGARHRGALLKDHGEGPGRDQPGPAGILPQAAAQGHQEGARRRGGRPRGGDGRTQGRDRCQGAARGGQDRGGQGPQAHLAHAALLVRVRHHPHLPGLDPRPPLAGMLGRQPRDRRRGEDPRRGPLRPEEAQEAHHRVPVGQEAQGRPQGPHPVLRGTAGRGQDVPGQVHRQGHGQEVRPHLAGRCTGRGRDQGPSQDLHRRPAGQDHQRHQDGGHGEPGLHARRDRQAHPRRPRRPGLGPA